MDIRKIINSGHFFIVIIVIWVCSVVINLFFYWLFDVLSLENVVISNKTISFMGVLSVIFIAPLVETFFFQLLPVSFLSMFSFFRKRKMLVILVSASVFALFHFDSLKRLMITFFCGLLLAGVYLLREKKDGFSVVAVSHAVWNAFVVIISSYVT